jgi:hypothetical protein
MHATQKYYIRHTLCFFFFYIFNPFCRGTIRRLYAEQVLRLCTVLAFPPSPSSYSAPRPNNLSLLCLYLSLYISFYYLDIFFFFLTYKDRKHYYIKVVESIQFVCAGNSGISRVVCNANTYRSIHEGLFFNSSPALDLKYPLRLPYIHFYFSSLQLQYKIIGIHS